MIRNLGKVKSVEGLNSRVQRAFPRLVKSLLSSPSAFLDSRHRQGIKLAISRETFVKERKTSGTFGSSVGLESGGAPNTRLEPPGSAEC